MSVTDLLPTIVPKSDQLNADDLIGRTMDITITKVSILGEADQPIAIHFEGDAGKPYKPCKSMRRVLVKVWGSDGNLFIGRRLRLFRDDNVKWGGVPVGGVRISHMSDIDRDLVIALTETRGARKPYTVHPLLDSSPSQRRQAQAPTQVNVEAVIAKGREAAARGSEALAAWWKSLNGPQQRAAKPTLDAELKPAAAKADLEVDDGAPFGDEPAAKPEGLDRDALGLKTGADLLAERSEAAPFDAVAWAGAMLRDLAGYAGAAVLQADFDEHKAELRQQSPGLFGELERAVEARIQELGRPS